MQSKKIAITGGIGSGKTVLCDMLRAMGYTVLSCDETSHALWQEREYRAELARLFPSCVRNGEIDKSLLSALVFNDEAARKRLENFSHPRIFERLTSDMVGGKIVFCEVPLLFEGGYERLFDGVVLLLRQEEERIRSVQVRDGLTEAQIRARMGAQLDVQAVKDKDVFIIENNGSVQDLRIKAEELLRHFDIK